MSRLLAVLALLLACAAARADGVQVAVAANFAGAMAEIGPAFTAATGHRIQLSSGSTGKFYAQVRAGAPFEVLLSADDETPARLMREGLAENGTAFTYAVGRLALWSATPGLVDPAGDVLKSAAWRHLAIANPRLAPYGRAASEALASMALAEAVAGRLVTAESVAQAYQFVATGNAEIGFVALSQLQQPGRPAGGSFWPVPASLHAELRQDAVLLKPGVGRPAAQALLDFLRGDAARRIIARHGYGLPAVGR